MSPQAEGRPINSRGARVPVSEATTAVPADAAAAPSPLTVRLEEFEGPLDLLLHLARTEEIDLARLPIRRITDQYLAYLESIEFRDLDDSGAFLVLAATLVYLKSRLLLPPAETEEESLEEDAELLRQELEARLRAYARVKEIGVWLREREAEWSTRFTRTWSELPVPEYLPIESLSLWDLTEAYRAFLVRLCPGRADAGGRARGPAAPRAHGDDLGRPRAVLVRPVLDAARDLAAPAGGGGDAPGGPRAGAPPARAGAAARSCSATS